MSCRTFTICAMMLVLLGLASARGAAAQDQPAAPELPPRAAPTVTVGVYNLPALATPKLDPDRATAGYLAQVSGPQRARSDAYFTGGYWLKLVDLIYGLVIAGLLLFLRLSAGLRDWAAERTRSRLAQTLIYVAAYVIAVTIAEFPLAVYEDFIREHAYGLANQNFPQWLGDFAIQFAVTLVAALIALPLLYAVIRRTRKQWWIWGAGLAIVLLVVQIAVYPIFIAPLFNHFSPLPEGPLKADILSLARANDVSAANVYLEDSSRQSNRISANVSGFLGTTRISLNDNLIKRGTHDEVLAVVGHEMGHYVMGHTTRLILLYGLVLAAGFGFAQLGFSLLADLFGGNWDVRRVEDTAGLPLLAALASIYFFIVTPVTNTISRTTEQQADIFGLDAVRKPDAFATLTLKLSAYRKLDPGHWEEIIFYDHPSGRTRIETAMRWKAEHMADLDIRSGPISPQ